MTPPEAADVRFLPARDVPIERATDLGSVQVLKHGNRYLLTDSFGDIHPDSRGLGLYHGDTPVPVVRRAAGRRCAAGAAPDLGGWQLPRQHPDDEPVGGPQSGREGPSARRAGGADDRHRSRAAHRWGRATRSGCGSSTTPRCRPASRSSSSSGMDGADIFEVRGFPRTERGRLLPIAVTDRRVTFRYDGVDGIQYLTHIELSEPVQAVEPVAEVAADGRNAGAALRLNWALTLGPGEVREVCWTVWTSQREAPGSGRDEATGRRELDVLFPSAPRVSGRRGCRGLPRVGARHDVGRQRPRAVQPRAEAVRVGPAPAHQRGPGPGRAIHRRRRAVVRDAVRPGRADHGVPVAGVPAADRRRDPGGAGRLPGHRGRPVAGRGAGQDPPRAADRGAGTGRRTAPHAVLRLGRLDAAVADPPGRDVRLDGGPRARRPPVAERPRGARVDRQARRPRRGRVRGVRAALGARPAEPGLEGLQRRHPRPDGGRGAGADRPGRGPGLRLRRQAADGGTGPGAWRGRAGGPARYRG